MLLENISFLPFKLKKWDYLQGLIVLALGRFVALHFWRIRAIFLWRNQRKGRQICKGKAGCSEVCPCAKGCCPTRGFPRWVWWDWKDSRARVPMGHCGMSREAAGSKREKTRNCVGCFGFGVAARTLPGSSCLVCVLQRLPIHPICVFMELQRSSSVSSWWKSSCAVPSDK